MVELNNCGVSKCADMPTEQDFINYSNANVKVMEVRANEYLIENLSTLKNYQDKYGVKINSVHLLYGKEYDISNPNEEISNASYENYVYYIENLKTLSKIFVLHPSCEPILPEDRQKHLSTAIKNLKKLADVADKNDVTIAVENLPRTCLGSKIEEFKFLLLADERLRVCFDVNHLLYDSHADFISNFGDKIITTHLSDYDFINERHLLPGEGKIDWVSLYENLKTVNYQGPLTFELEPYSTNNVYRPTPLTLNDYRAVFDAIVSKTEIPTFNHQLLYTK